MQFLALDLATGRWLAGRPAGWLARWLAGWLAGSLNGWLPGWLVEWLAGWLTSWLADWLAGWLATSLLFRIYGFPARARIGHSYATCRGFGLSLQCILHVTQFVSCEINTRMFFHHQTTQDHPVRWS